MKISIFLAGVISLIACNMPKYSDKEIEQMLHDRYQEEFKVTENYYFLAQNNYQFTAETKAEPKITLYGSYSKKLDGITDDYPYRFHTFQAQKPALDFLKKYYLPIAMKTTVSSRYKHKEGSKVIGYEQLMLDESFRTTLEFHIYLFDTVNENNKEEVLKGIKAYMEELGEFKNKRYEFLVKFWDKSFLEGKDFDQLNFGFNVTNEDYIDNGDLKREYIRQGLGFEFLSEQERSITIDTLYSCIGPYKNNRGYKIKRFWKELEDNRSGQ